MVYLAAPLRAHALWRLVYEQLLSDHVRLSAETTTACGCTYIKDSTLMANTHDDDDGLSLALFRTARNSSYKNSFFVGQ